MTERELFELTAGYAADFVETLDVRLIRPEADVEQLVDARGGPLPEAGADPRVVAAGVRA